MSQVQVHHFEKPEEPGEKRGPRGPAAQGQRDGWAQASRHAPLVRGPRASEPARAAQQLPVEPGAGQSMSTIIEDDAETSGGPAQVGTPAAPTAPVGRVPADDKFGGTLSALAAQMERLRRAELARQRPVEPADTGARSPSGSRAARAATDGPAGEPQQETRPKSADALMVISISPPIGSPPAGEPSQIVEVANKSTLTTIDMGLMGRLVDRYFADRADKSTQSIEFDCDESELNTIDFSGAGQRPQVSRWKQTKSVATGSDKLSQTKTQYTQTQVSHEDQRTAGEAALGALVAGGQHTTAALDPIGRGVGAPGTGAHPRAGPRAGLATELDQRPAPDSLSDDDQAADRCARSAGATDPATGDSLQGDQADSLATSAASQHPAGLPDTPEPDAPAGGRNSAAAPVGEPGKAAADRPQQASSLKTEVRVVIEFADLRQKQRSQLTSNSQLVDGKLSKRTEVSTSKHVAVAPQQVRDGPEPEGVESEAAPLQACQWQEVSKSSVCNEFETDARRRRHEGPSASELDDIVLSSDATIRRFLDDKSAIELRSRAARRYVNEEERLLVESESAFDERQPQLGASGPAGRQWAPVAPQSVASASALDSRARQGPRATEARVWPRTRPDPTGRAEVSGGQLGSPIKVASKQQGGPDGQANSAGQQDGQSSRALADARDTHQTANGSPPIAPPEVPGQFVAEPIRVGARQPSQIGIAHQTGGRTQGSRVEIERQSENRHQVSENGRVIYDDRLREHHKETRQLPTGHWPARATGPSDERPAGSDATTRSGPVGPARYTGGPGLAGARPAGGRAQLLKPLRLAPATSPASPAGVYLADQTSNLSSDLDTLDSGFVQSRAGSSSHLGHLFWLAQQQAAPAGNQIKANQQPGSGKLAEPSGAGQAPPAVEQNDAKQNGTQAELRAASGADEDLDTSLAFVDDNEDDDRLIEQLGAAGQAATRERA